MTTDDYWHSPVWSQVPVAVVPLTDKWTQEHIFLPYSLLTPDSEAYGNKSSSKVELWS